MNPFYHTLIPAYSLDKGIHDYLQRFDEARHKSYCSNKSSAQVMSAFAANNMQIGGISNQAASFRWKARNH
ncbi:hypothetical protein A0J61_10165 [Choanephora cucurbitarum]|uniref:Uncharacterized protein n=1 Tax=Choanephora cucurbitarum TaxID=101091 RepID=A0A1C7MYF0_9FUNG|nr:hypothetical protein A0J61_10165 [Choanephora cucurbitarum]